MNENLTPFISAQEALNDLIGYFLGEHWYVVGSLSVEQTNAIAVEEIKHCYRGKKRVVTAGEWRKRHKKCKWCKHCRHVNPALKLHINVPDYFECDVKDRKVNENIPRLFCRVFDLKIDLRRKDEYSKSRKNYKAPQGASHDQR